MIIVRKTGILPNVNDYIKNSKLNIKVFAESKYILDTIKSYPEITSKTFTRQDIPTCDVVMFLIILLINKLLI